LEGWCFLFYFIFIIFIYVSIEEMNMHLTGGGLLCIRPRFKLTIVVTQQ